MSTAGKWGIALVLVLVGAIVVYVKSAVDKVRETAAQLQST